MKLQFVNLQAQYENYKDEIDAAIKDVLNSAKFIMGPQVLELEKALSDFTGSNAITCANGTDALMIALKLQESGRVMRLLHHLSLLLQLQK